MSRARTFADLATASEAGSLSNRNMLHNGNFAVHQRGETISITAGQSGYTMDRWLVDSVGTDQLVYTIMMVKPYKPQANIDGMKPISQSMPQYTQQPMTQAQPSAPDHAQPVEKMSDMDDEIPF